jgi:hypothetical protein
VFRGEAITKGYWGEPKATREAIRESCLHTDDLMQMYVGGAMQLPGHEVTIRQASREIATAACTRDPRRAQYCRGAVGAFVADHAPQPAHDVAWNQQPKKTFSAPMRVQTPRSA